MLKHHRKRKIALWIILSFIVLIVVFRLLLPTIVLKYVNKTLQEIEGYRGHVEDIDIGIYRGAYQIQGIKLEKFNGKVPEPFFSAHEIDISIQWNEIFKGAIAGEIIVDRPVINFVQGPTADQSQEGVDSNWVDVVDKWIPIKLNRVLIRDGEVHYKDISTKPHVDVYLNKLQAEALNLSNTNKSNDLLPSTVKAKANAYGDGTFDFSMKLNALAKDPTFDLNAELKNVNMVKLNDFLQAYAKIDVKSGTFGLYTEIAAKNGAYKGYVKPTLANLDILQLNKEEGSKLQIAWEAIAAAGAKLLENKSEDRIATKAPIEGTFEAGTVDIWATVGSLLRNAFIKSLVPSIDQSITINDVGGGKVEMKMEESRKERRQRKKAEKDKKD